ncbi:MAG: hypothetical protein ABIO02_00840 [Patescibacteria group bacterium]
MGETFVPLEATLQQALEAKALQDQFNSLGRKNQEKGYDLGFVDHILKRSGGYFTDDPDLFLYGQLAYMINKHVSLITATLQDEMLQDEELELIAREVPHNDYEDEEEQLLVA